LLGTDFCECQTGRRGSSNLLWIFGDAILADQVICVGFGIRNNLAEWRETVWWPSKAAVLPEDCLSTALEDRRTADPLARMIHQPQGASPRLQHHSTETGR
jgi:hypothetical protein